MQSGGGPGPLEGIRILELGTLLAGPFVGRLLGDFGAEVIKVEDPGRGDPMREWGHHRYRGRTLWWPVQSRNKKSITLNLRHEDGQRLLLRLAEKADVLVENFRPGTLERWGIGPEALHRVNPRLVIARVSGFGQDGPYAHRAGFAAVGEAMGGIRYINGYPGQPPPRTGISLGDSLAAMFAVQGILMALYWRDALGGGKGQIVDASIVESCFALLESALPEYDRLGVVRQPSGTKLPRVAPSNIYRTKDERWIVIAANADNVFGRLCQAIGRPELATDPRFATHAARGEHQEELDALIAEWAATRTAQEIDQLMDKWGVPCGPIYTIADIWADPHFRARGMILTMEDPELGPIATPGIIPKLSETPGAARWTGPWELGAHNREIYCGLLGLSEAELEDLKARQVI